MAVWLSADWLGDGGGKQCVAYHSLYYCSLSLSIVSSKLSFLNPRGFTIHSPTLRGRRERTVVWCFVASWVYQDKSLRI